MVVSHIVISGSSWCCTCGQLLIRWNDTKLFIAWVNCHPLNYCRLTVTWLSVAPWRSVR